MFQVLIQICSEDLGDILKQWFAVEMTRGSQSVFQTVIQIFTLVLEGFSIMTAGWSSDARFY